MRASTSQNAFVLNRLHRADTMAAPPPDRREWLAVVSI